LSQVIDPALAHAAIDALASRGLLAVLGGKFTEEILTLGRRRVLGPGEVLFRQGDPGDAAYVVLEGTLEVWVDIGAERVRMAVLRPLELVGEIAVFTQQPRIATVSAPGIAMVLVIAREALVDLVEKSSSAAQAIIADLGRRLGTVNTPLAFLSTATQLLRTEQLDAEALAEMARASGNLGPFADTFASMVQEIRSKQERRQDMEMARRIQQSVLPKSLALDPALACIAATVRPMKEVGGDLYDYFMIDEDRLAFAVADVSGKGVPASLFMMMFHTALRAVARSGLGTAEALARVNEQLSEDNDECMFVTAFFGILDIRRGALSYVNAGHNPTYLLARDGILSPLPGAGIAVGLSAKASYRAQSLTLSAGDRLFLYTDGVTEAFSAAREPFGEARLEAVLAGGADLPVEGWMAAVLAAVDEFAAGAEPSDDVTCLALGFRPAG
jgi:serine phosphatase RsbU (regulator of sigma subunit)